MRKLIIDENNVVLNIIVDVDDVINGENIIFSIDDDVGIGDTVTNSGILLTRRSDYHVPTDEEREIEEANRRKLIIDDLNNKI